MFSYYRTTMSFAGVLSCKIAWANADGAAASATRTTANAMLLLFKSLLRSRPLDAANGNVCQRWKGGARSP